jgi:hypothetical protein
MATEASAIIPTTPQANAMNELQALWTKDPGPRYIALYGEPETGKTMITKILTLPSGWTAEEGLPDKLGDALPDRTACVLYTTCTKPPKEWMDRADCAVVYLCKSNTRVGADSP